MKTVILNNRYRVERLLGRGGFGQTFLATDIHMPSGRKCVIKQLQPLAASPKQQVWARERFQNEASILERLGRRCPQIPELFAYFAEDGDFFLVQEWVDGVTLFDKVRKEGPLGESWVVELLGEVCRILEFVHGNRIIHRDIKPDNIILRSADLKPVLIDFGAVKEALMTVLAMQNTSVAIGTPGYMPSEQAAGRPGFSSDLYALGLTAVYLLTGKNPSDISTDPRTGELLWRKSLPETDSRLIKVLEKTLCFNPHDRFASAKEMRMALQQTELKTSSLIRTRAVAPRRNHSIAQRGKNISPVPQQSSLLRDSSSRRLSRPPTSRVNKSGIWKVLTLFFILTGISVGAFALGFNGFNFLFTAGSESSSQRDDQIQSNTESGVANRDHKTAQTDIKTENTNRTPPKQEESLPENSSIEASEVSRETEQDEKSAKNETDDTGLNQTITADNDKKPREARAKDRISESQTDLIKRLGPPTGKEPGLRSNTHTLVYNNPNDNSQSRYVIDTGTQQIRESQLTLSSKADLKQMETGLTQLLNAPAPKPLHPILAEIESGKTDLRAF
ncbi:MAG: serine/threonine-protein kinase, partial [Cyanobacteria bacterium P01_H01_bin.15]